MATRPSKARKNRRMCKEKQLAVRRSTRISQLQSNAVDTAGVARPSLAPGTGTGQSTSLHPVPTRHESRKRKKTPAIKIPVWLSKWWKEHYVRNGFGDGRLYNEWVRQGKCKMLRHTPLESPHDQIRVLQVPAAPYAAPLYCQVQVKDLNKSANYDALSYTWGKRTPDNLPPFLIVLDERVIEVRENLWYALKAIRSQHHDTRIWVDALCIDQYDVTERNVQVSIMSSIYRYAKVVRVDLGHGVVSSDALCVFRSWARVRDLCRTQEQNDCRNEAFDWFVDLAKLPYWNRAWIRQEILHAQKVVYVQGEGVLPGWKLLELCESLGLTPDEDPDVRNMVSLMLSGDLPANRRPTQLLFMLLEKYGMSQCGDLRDRVFSLLSMANDSPQSADEHCSFRADYRMSYDEVIVRTVVHCGWEDGPKLFAVFGKYEYLRPTFEHPVELLEACSKLLIDRPSLVRDGCDFTDLLQMASEMLAEPNDVHGVSPDVGRH